MRRTVSDYAEAAADPAGWQPEPGMVIRPFHEKYPGMPQLFHVYCEAHPDFGFCGVEHVAREAALGHGQREHRADEGGNGS